MEKQKRGGFRENAGRKKGDKETFPVRCKKENITKIREWIKTKDY